MSPRSLPGTVLLGFLLQVGFVLGADTPPAADLFVSPQGQDGWSGKLAAPNAERTDGPLASLAGARDAIRRRKAAGPLAAPLRVLVRRGTYRVKGPIVLTAADGGTEQAPITYAAWPGETPVISGGVAISGWTRQGEGSLWTTTVPKVKSGDWYFRQIFI